MKHLERAFSALFGAMAAFMGIAPDRLVPEDNRPANMPKAGDRKVYYNKGWYSRHPQVNQRQRRKRLRQVGYR